MQELEYVEYLDIDEVIRYYQTDELPDIIQHLIELEIDFSEGR